jgi:DNA-directed RNA polymerase subunit RPC12/RpoP
MKRSHINKDTYLTCWCPHCGKGLNEDGKAVFRIENNAGDIGISKVSPYLNVLDRESTIHVEDDEELADVRCPHCDVSFIEPDHVCKQDKCKMIKFHISVSNSIKLLITLCVRRTCRWYTMSEEDNERLILRDSNEW